MTRETDDPGIEETLINARYRIICELGQGGKGKVFLAEHVLINTKVALKVLNQRNSRNAKDLERLRKEASIAATMDHENLVGVRDFGTTDDGSGYLVMDYVEGSSLKDIMAYERETLTEERCLNLIRQITRGLQHLHEHGIVHRDIKPENIIVKKNGMVKLIDFGVAKPENEEGAVQALTRTGDIVGSPYYMSPEQCQSGKHADSRSDLYALGCLIFEIVNNRPPYRGQTILKTLDMHINDPLPTQGSTGKGVKPALVRIALKCIEKKPENRYQKAEEIIAELDALKPVAKQSPQAAFIKFVPFVVLILIAIGASWGAYQFGQTQKAQENSQGESHLINRITDALYLMDEASFQERTGHAPQARKAFEAALKVADLPDPMMCVIGAEYGQHIFERGRDNWKEQILEIYNKLEPRLERLSAEKSKYREVGIGSAPILYLLGAEAVFDQNDLKPALLKCNKAYSLAKKYPKSKWTIPDIRLVRAQIYDLQNKPDEAIEDAEFCIAEYEKKMGKDGRSVVRFTGASGVSPTILTVAYAILEHAYRSKGDNAKADEIIAQIQHRCDQLHIRGLPPFREHAPKMRASFINQMSR